MKLWPFTGTSENAARLPFFYGWVILCVAGFAHFASGPGQTYVASIFIEPMISEMGWSRTLFSGLYTAGSLTAALMMVLVGRMLDKYGARVVLSVVAALVGVSAIWMSTVNHPVQLFIGFAALRTFGQGSLGLVATTMVAMWFIRLRGRATAVASLGQAGSQAVFPIIAHLMILQLGWRGAWVGLAVIVWGVLLLPSVLFARRSPESVGLLPDGTRSKLSTVDVDTTSSASPENDFSLGDALRTPTLWLLVVAGMAMPMIMTGLMFHHISFMGSKGVSAGTAAVVLSVFGPVMLCGNIFGGFLSDKIQNRFLLAAGQLLLAATMLWTFAISEPWHAFAYIILGAFSAGLVSTTYAVIWPNYFGRAHLGSIRGLATTSMVGFSALGALPFGLVFDITGSYDLAILILLTLPVVCTIASFLASPPKKSSRYVIEVSG